MVFSPLIPGTPPGPGEVYAHIGGSGILSVWGTLAPAPAQEGAPFGFKILEALTYAFGKELQLLGGAPETKTAFPFSYADPFIRVESTLGFPRAADVFVGGLRVRYTSKTEDRLILPEPFDAFVTIPRNTPVHLITASVTPDGAGTGTQVLP